MSILLNPVLVSVVVGITNMIPFFGPFIGAVPSALLILLESPTKCLAFVIFILVLQQIDGNIICPRIHGTKMGISGFWIMSAILLFGSLFGFWGMLLGVPIFSVLYDTIRRFAESRLIRKNMSSRTRDYMTATFAGSGGAKAEADSERLRREAHETSFEPATAEAEAFISPVDATPEKKDEH